MTQGLLSRLSSPVSYQEWVGTVGSLMTQSNGSDVFTGQDTNLAPCPYPPIHLRVASEKPVSGAAL